MRRGATLVEALVAAGLGLLALALVFGFASQAQRHDARLDAAAGRIQAVAHLRDALSLDLAGAAAPELVGRPSVAVARGGAALEIVTARRLTTGQVERVTVVWAFDGSLTRAGEPFATTGLTKVSFGLEADPELAVTITAFDARGPLAVRLPVAEAAAGLDGFVPAIAIR